MTSPDLSLVRSGFTWMFCLRGVMDGTNCLILVSLSLREGSGPSGFTHLALLPHTKWTFHWSLRSTGIWQHSHPHSCRYNSQHPCQCPLGEEERWENEKQVSPWKMEPPPNPVLRLLGKHVTGNPMSDIRQCAWRWLSCLAIASRWLSLLISTLSLTKYFWVLIPSSGRDMT